MKSPPSLDRREFLAALALPALAHALPAAGAAPDSSPEGGLAAWIAAQRKLSYQHLLRNVSPAAPFERDVESKYIAPERLEYVRAESARAGGRIRLNGDRVWQRIVPVTGSVAASAPGGPSEPDYFFHWTRDSALVMHALATLQADAPPPQAAECARHLEDFIRFSRTLQQSAAPAGIGETRFNMDGTLDFLQWNRPQHDGPGLRSLALMHYESLAAAVLPGELAVTLDEAVRADLDFLAANWMRPSYDLWEEYSSPDFHALVVQAGALDAGARRALAAGDQGRAGPYAAAASALRESLARHWLPDRGYYGFHREPVRPGDNLDVAVVIGALHGRLADGAGSLLDDRVLATLSKLEGLFARLYPFNARLAADEGLLYGRYEGDQYYGGNPWGMLTLECAEAQYQLAALLAQRASLQVTALNRPLFARALERAGHAGELGDGGDLFADPAARGVIVRGFTARGDDILRTLRRLTPPAGDMPEQYDKSSGVPVSTRNLAWSHAAFISAASAREAVAAGLG